MDITVKHLQEFEKSGISAEFAAKYFRSLTQEEASKKYSSPCPGWEVLYPQSNYSKFKPDNPRNKSQKYINPKGVPLDLLITFKAQEALNNINISIFLIEGEKKTVSAEENFGWAAIGLPGVNGQPEDKLASLNFAGRICYICFDADKNKKQYKKSPVIDAEARLARALTLKGAKVKIINLEKSFGNGLDDQIVKFKADGNLNDLKNRLLKQAVDFAPEPLPLSLTEFLKKDIPPIEYYVQGILQKGGRTMISAPTNIGKSFFLQNLALAVASGNADFLGKFKVSPASVLYLDMEMGEPALKERFTRMIGENTADNLFVQYACGLDLLENESQFKVEFWLQNRRPDILIIDSIGDAWTGDENDKQEVAKLEKYLNYIKDKFKISIIFSHHWRKASKENNRGPEMAAGSYKIGAWVENQLSLQGADCKSVTLTWEKARNALKPPPILIGLDPDTLCFKYIGDYESKFSEDMLEKVFVAYGQEEAPLSKLVELADEMAERKELPVKGRSIRGYFMEKTQRFEVWQKENKPKAPWFVKRKGLNTENELF